MRTTSIQSDDRCQTFCRRLSLMVIVGALTVWLTSCTGLRQQSLVECDEVPDCATPTNDGGQFLPLSPVPRTCRRVPPRDQRQDQENRLSPGIVPPLPALGAITSAQQPQTAVLEKRIEQLQVAVHRQQRLIDTADGERTLIEHSVRCRAEDLLRDLVHIQERQAEMSSEMARLSGNLDRLASIQAADREEHSRMLDEIILGLEQALSSAQRMDKDAIERDSSALRGSGQQP